MRGRGVEVSKTLFRVIVCKNLSVAGICMPETEVFPHWNKLSETRKQIVNRMRKMNGNSKI